MRLPRSRQSSCRNRFHAWPRSATRPGPYWTEACCASPSRKSAKSDPVPGIGAPSATTGRVEAGEDEAAARVGVRLAVEPLRAEAAPEADVVRAPAGASPSRSRVNRWSSRDDGLRSRRLVRLVNERFGTPQSNGIARRALDAGLPGDVAHVREDVLALRLGCGCSRSGAGGTRGPVGKRAARPARPSSSRASSRRASGKLGVSSAARVSIGERHADARAPAEARPAAALTAGPARRAASCRSPAQRLRQAQR